MNNAIYNLAREYGATINHDARALTFSTQLQAARFHNRLLGNGIPTKGRHSKIVWLNHELTYS